MYIIGTAGHVDHGKSSLVKALTGVDPDRLPQERERALTIDLGFASFSDSSGNTIGLIDVPGHERFIRNMASGLWSLDLALLIVAADDGWMEQSEDHCAMLKAMGVPIPLVVITKADLVDPTRLHEVEEEVCEHLSLLYQERCIVVTTSAKEGTGIEELKQAIEERLGHQSRRVFPPALYIDRSFIVDGFGAVVTGSLRALQLTVGDEVTILPSGKRARIRGLQSFSSHVERAGDGNRLALSLAAIDADQLLRGDVITTHSEHYTLSQELVLTLAPLYEGESLQLKRRVAVEVATGTWHGWATLVIRAPDSRLATLHVEAVRPWYYGQPVALIRSGSSKVVAMGRVLVPRALSRAQRTILVQTIQDEHALGALSSEERVYQHLNGYALYRDDDPGSLFLLDQHYDHHGRWVIRRDLVVGFEEWLVDELGRRSPLPLETAKSESPYPADLTAALITMLIEKRTITLGGTNLQLASESDRPLSEEESELLTRIAKSGLEGYEVRRIQKSEKRILGSLLQRQLVLIVESTFIYDRPTFERIIRLILTDKPVGSLFSIAEARTHLPLSRKYLLPLLNTLEEEGYVQRFGDKRRVEKLPE